MLLQPTLDTPLPLTVDLALKATVCCVLTSSMGTAVQVAMPPPPLRNPRNATQTAFSGWALP